MTITVNVSAIPTSQTAVLLVAIFLKEFPVLPLRYWPTKSLSGYHE